MSDRFGANINDVPEELTVTRPIGVTMEVFFILPKELRVALDYADEKWDTVLVMQEYLKLTDKWGSDIAITEVKKMIKKWDDDLNRDNRIKMRMTKK